MRLSSCTLCWVGLVFSSRAASSHGTNVTWQYSTFSRPTLDAICLMASRKGSPSMSPTVPPISAMTMSLLSPVRRMRSCISLVMCGITCTVPPR
ncbi:MAG: hypothetical protein BWY99_02575 [Synergistetes bacterium ADurb.BinA166]|nr:MAG: hypothetical protein BWY99_02575 [Synergistetes bacterium ADurb.BinA166]